MTIPRSDRVSTENGWKSILLENVNHFNLNRFGLKRLIPIEHDLSVTFVSYRRENDEIFLDTRLLISRERKERINKN